MTESAMAVLALAVIDSINPSALVVTIYLLSQPGAVPRVLCYAAGILVSYLALGVALMLGVGTLFERFGAAFDHPVAWGAQAVLGAGMLVFAIAAPKSSAASTRAPPTPRIGGLLGMVVLGATVTAVELVTALPYFAAIAIMVGADLSVTVWAPLLLVYNLIFIFPPLALLGLHVVLGPRLHARYGRWQARLQAGARETLLWIVAIVGVGLMFDAVARFRTAG